MASRNLRALASVVITVGLCVSACGGTSRDPLAGTYLVEGGGAPLDVYKALSTEFLAKHPGVKFVFEDVGSLPGMRLVANGDTDLATSSNEPESTLRDRVVVVPVGMTGTAVVVGAANKVPGLTRDQVRAIFTGEISDWKDVGGEPGRIIVAMRNANSAIRANFEAYFFAAKPTYPKDMFEVNDIEQTITAISGLRSVVSIITISDRSLNETRIRLLPVDGIAPTRENLASGAYPVRRPLYLIANATSMKPAIRAFLDFVRSPDGQRIIGERGAG
jgi:phosphate transport system substrate-binding protein